MTPGQVANPLRFSEVHLHRQRQRQGSLSALPGDCRACVGAAIRHPAGDAHGLAESVLLPFLLKNEEDDRVPTGTGRWQESAKKEKGAERPKRQRPLCQKPQASFYRGTPGNELFIQWAGSNRAAILCLQHLLLEAEVTGT